MSINTQKSRERIKRSTLTGVVPTVPVSADFTDGTWLNTDIRAGEFFYNIPDEKLWIGTNTVPLEITGSFGLTLADVLANGYVTGGSDIEMSLGDSITSPAISGVRNSALNLGQIDTTVSYTDTALTMFSKSIYETGRIRNIVNDASNSTPVVGDIYAMVDILNTSGGQTTVGLIVNNLVNNSFAHIILDGDASNPNISQYTTNNTLYSTISQIPSQIKLFSSDSIGMPNPATDTYSLINLFGIDINKPNILLQTVRPGNYNQYIALAHTGLEIYTDNNLIINTLALNIIGQYNSISTDILLYADNFASSITSSANQTPGIIIGSQNSTIAAGIFNSAIIGGDNNQIIAGSGNILSGTTNINTLGNYNFISGTTNINTLGNYNFISGDTNTNTSGSGNIISGINNTITGFSSIISGTNNSINSGARNIISGDANIVNGFSNIVSGQNNTISTGFNNSNFITGEFNTITAGVENIMYGDGNTITSGNFNILGGISNTNTSGNGNILSGYGNEIYVSNSLLVGSNNIMFNPGIMYGNGGVDVISNGFSNTYGNTANATPTLLTTDGTNSFKILIDTTFRVELTLLVKNINTGDAKEWKGFGIIKNVAGTTSLVGGTLTMTSTIGDVSLATTSVTVTANNTTDCLDITVTGIAATNLLWNCGIEYVLVNV